MTLRALYQQIGQLQREAGRYAQSIELIDRIAETCGHPQQETAAHGASVLRRELSALYTRIHYLESRIPTPETLSRAAYNRAFVLGLGIEAAEAERIKAYRTATADRRHAA